jgi:hypothetical protein
LTFELSLMTTPQFTSETFLYGTPALQEFWCTVVLHGHRNIVQKPEDHLKGWSWGSYPTTW